MTRQLVTVDPADRLSIIKSVFDTHNIHHIPVVRYKTIVGIISKSDFDQFLFLRPDSIGTKKSALEGGQLDAWKARDIMTKKLAKVSSIDPIRTAIDLFKLNRFHALPVVDEEELVGMVTTFDIIKSIAEAPVALEDYKTASA